MFVLGMDSTVDTTTLPYLPKVFSGGCSKVVARQLGSLARGVFGGKALVDLVALVDRRFQAATKQRRDRTLLPGVLGKNVAISRNLHCGLVSWLVRTPGRPKSAIQYPQAASQMAITRNLPPPK